MKIVNRGYIIVRPTQQFWNWANTFEDEMEFSVEDEMDPNIYLISEDFFDIEPLIEQHYKMIFASELSMVTEDELDWPENRNLELFLEWFELEIGSTVFDLEKSDLKTEKL